MSETATVSISHIDTCLSCYLDDHHNREGEYLIGVTITNQTTYKEVLSQISESFDIFDDAGRNNLTSNQIESINGAFDEEILRITSKVSDLREIFDDSLEDEDEDSHNCEDVQAWFLVSYEINDAN